VKKILLCFLILCMLITNVFLLRIPLFTATVLAADVSFSPVVDTYVQSTDDSDNPPNHSAEVLIRLRNAPPQNPTGFLAESFLRFEVTGLGDEDAVKSAEIILYCTSVSGTNGKTYLYGIEDEWESGTISWNNRPNSANGVLIAEVNNDESISAGQTIIFDVSSYITDNGTYSFLLRTENGPVITIASSENAHADWRPIMRINYTEAGSPGDSEPLYPVHNPFRPLPEGIDPQNEYARYGYLDVTLYGADPTGTRDSTVELQNAIDAAYENKMVVFFPSGTYLISDTLKMMRVMDPDGFRTRKGHVLEGSMVGPRPIIKLRDNSPGFNDPSVEHTEPYAPTTTKAVLHFWTAKNASNPNPENEDGSNDYNQVIRGIDIDLGNGNSGAVAVRHRGAEGTNMQDVKINATGAFAGIYSLIGSGGSIVNVEIIGGKYGIYATHTQPMPTVVGIKMLGQTDKAIYYRGMTPLNIVGFEIQKSKGPIAYVFKDPKSQESFGNIALIDGKIELIDGDENDAIIENTDRMVYLKNVYVKNAGKIVTSTFDNSSLTVDNHAVWNKVEEYAYSKDNFPDNSKIIYGEYKNEPYVSLVNGSEKPPSDLISRHMWDKSYWSFEEEGVINVEDFGAKGDGVTDDTQAIRNAIAAGDKVFIPRGNYKVSGTIKLNEHTKLFGIARHLTSLEPLGWSAEENTPIIESADSKDSTNVLANMKIELYRTRDKIYAIKWMAGRNSIVNSVWICWDFDPNSTSPNVLQRVIITGNGGGRWYNHTSEIGWNTNPEGHRSVLIDGTTEPLTFYMFHNQHIKSDSISEVKNASNVTFYGVKTETQTTGDPHNKNNPNSPWPLSLKISNSSNIQIFGYSGLGQAKEDRGLFEIFDSVNVTVANMARWGPTQYELDEWYYIKVSKNGVTKGIHANTPVNLMKIGEEIWEIAPDTEPPVFVSGSLTASNVTQSSLTLNWPVAIDNVGTTGYEVYMNDLLYTTVTGSVLSADITGLAAGTTYSFKVKAGDAAGNFTDTGLNGNFKAADKIDSYLDYGLVDVTEAPYSADPTGIIDSTFALQSAITYAADHGLAVFIPLGTYLISDTLEADQITKAYGDIKPNKPCIIIGGGNGEIQPKIVLAPNSNGFQNPNAPKNVIYIWTHGADVFENPQPNINTNQIIRNIDIEIGEGNPGAIGIHHDGAQGSGIENVTVYAGDGYAGIFGLQAGGGGTHNVTVYGGMYGLDASSSLATAATVSGSTFIGQRKSAVIYNGLETMSLVGADIVVPEGATGPAICLAGTDATRGTMSIADTKIVFEKQEETNTAIGGNRSVYLKDVWVQGANIIVQTSDGGSLDGLISGWRQVLEYTHNVQPHKISNWDRAQFKHTSYIDGQPTISDVVVLGRDEEPPPSDLQSRHIWYCSDLELATAANIRKAPYNAVGSVGVDDYEALQSAIDENEIVFIPKGVFYTSKTLKLRPDTKLIGIGQISSIQALKTDGGDFCDESNLQPLILSADDANAETVVAYLTLGADVTTKPNNSAIIHWRSGRNSVIRTVNIIRPIKTVAPILATGNGGGRWYSLKLINRTHIEGTHEPLRMYQANPEKGLGQAGIGGVGEADYPPHITIKDASNVTIYGLKEEGINSLYVSDSDFINIFGYGGVATALEGTSLFNIERTPNFRLVGLMDRGGKLGTDPNKWFMVTETTVDGQVIQTEPLERITLYKRGYVIEGISPLSDITVNQWINPEEISLPSVVTAIYSNGTMVQKNVVWNTKNLNTKVAGIYELEGTVESTTLKAFVKVVVQELKAFVISNTSIDRENGGIYAQATVTPSTALSSGEAVVIFKLEDGDTVLNMIAVKSYIDAAETFTGKFFEYSGGEYTVKVYVWDKLDNCENSVGENLAEPVVIR